MKTFDEDLSKTEQTQLLKCLACCVAAAADNTGVSISTMQSYLCVFVSVFLLPLSAQHLSSCSWLDM